MLARADEEEEEEEEEEDGVFFMFLLGDFSSESSVTRCFERGQSVDPAVASPCVGGDFVASGTGCILLGGGGGVDPLFLGEKMPLSFGIRPGRASV